MKAIDRNVLQPTTLGAATISVATWLYIAYFIIMLPLTLIDISRNDTLNNLMAGNPSLLDVYNLSSLLFCLAVGWQVAPDFTRDELKSAPRHANQKAAKEAAEGIEQARQTIPQATKSPNAEVTDDSLREMEVSRGTGDKHAEPAPELSAGSGGFLQRRRTTMPLTVGGVFVVAVVAATVAFFKKDETEIEYMWATDHMKYVRDPRNEVELNNRLETIVGFDKKMGILFRTCVV